MIKKITVLVIASIFFVSFATFAAENESWIQKIKNKFQKKETVAAGKTAPVKEVKKAEAPKKERKDITKDELVRDIIKNLDREGSILNLVPGLEKKSGPEGKEYYTYQGTRLEDLDKDTLGKIFGRVCNEALRLRTDKLNRQLETVRRQSAIRAAVPQVPRVSVPPTVKIPQQVPKSVQSPSKPPAPPAPPRR